MLKCVSGLRIRDRMQSGELRRREINVQYYEINQNQLKLFGHKGRINDEVSYIMEIGRGRYHHT